MPQCQQCKKQFNITQQVQSLMERLKLHDLKYCFDCAKQIRLSFWPYGNFYPKKDDLTGENIITTYPPQTKFPIYKRSNWHSDNWQAPQIEYDKNRTFFEQLIELQQKTPHFHALGDAESENCDYCDDVWASRNCYYNRSFAECENLHYSYRNVKVKDSIDTTFCFNLNNCYDCTYCFDSYGLKYSINSRNCLDSYFLYDCRQCENCFMCWNLRHKKYCIKNEQYSEKDYNNKIKEYKLNDYQKLQKLKQEFSKILKDRAQHKQDLNTKVENCNGNFLDKDKYLCNCYLTQESENCYDFFRGLQNKDSLSTSGLYKGELNYFVVQSTNIYNSKFILYSVNCSDCEYLDQCYDCKDCFGCVGLKKQQYYILNKQYVEEEYYQIINILRKTSDYGKFFPQIMAYNGYNASLARFYYPLNQEEIIKFGSYYEEEPVVINKKDAIICEVTKKPFKLIPQEIEFYQKNNIPTPHHHPDHRNIVRYQFMTAVKPQLGNCYKCQKEIIHYYPQEWNYQNILCNKCYHENIY